MQDVTTPMQTALAMRSAQAPASITRQPVFLYEVYPNDHYPPVGQGFDPADAVERWSEVGITWQGRNYRRMVLSHGDVQRFLTSEFNRIELSLDNSDLYIAQFVISNPVEGMRLVIRYIDRALSATLADSLVCFTGRLERPSELDEETCRITAKQDIGSINYEMPRRTFSASDPLGRSQNDPLYEGFKFAAIVGTFQYQVEVTKRFLFFFTKKKKQLKTEQWSSENNPHEGETIPNIYGRCQIELIPVLWADVGTAIKGIFVAAGQRLSALTDFRNQTQGLTGPYWDNGASAPELGVNLHLGDPGGTGTNAQPTDQFPQAGFLSRTAYTSLYVIGSSPEVLDSAPTITAIAKGAAPVPSPEGQFSGEEFTDNPSYLTRFVLTGEDGLGLDERLIDDSECILTGLLCNEPLLDSTDQELAVLSPEDAEGLASDLIRRYRSSGILNPRYYRWYLDSEGLLDPQLHDPWLRPIDDPYIYDIFDPPPAPLAPATFFRRRYTFNAPLTDKIKAVDFLFNILLPSFRGYMLIGPDGRLKIRTERPADSSFVRANALVGESVIRIADVDPWFGLTPLVNQFYLASLLRSPTGPELTAALAATQTASGLSVAGAASVIHGVFNGAEYTARGRTDSEFVEDVFQAYLGRQSDPGGFQYWLDGTVANGRNATLNAFDLSVEFRARVEKTGKATQGFALIGVGLVTSEAKKVSGATYSAAGNTIPIVAQATGSMGLTASGATLAGGTDYVPPSGSFTVSGTPAAGLQIAATIDGVLCPYTLTADDDLSTAAAMLATAINATWSLKPYIRAVWDTTEPEVVRVYSKLGSINLTTPLEHDHNFLLLSPTVAPNGVAAAGGALPAGDYTLSYSYTTDVGETFTSPVQVITLAANQKINVPSRVLPAGVAGLKWYLSKAPGDITQGYLVSNTGAAFTINALPLPDSSPVPLTNTAGEETIRVMASFTKENILKGKFRWPIADQGTSTNQILIKHREAAAGFAERELYVNDFAHQRQIGRVNKIEIDGAGIDNFHQASRIANSRLSKEREGDFFVEWDTDIAGIIFEEGDVVCASDRSGGWVNLPLRIEQVRIHPDFTVTFIGRLYSTVMYADQTGQRPITLPSTLKYLNQAPPAIAVLTLTEVGGYSPDLSFITGIRGDFDFGGFAGGQTALVFIKGGPGVTLEPDDTEYKQVDVVTPDENGHGGFEIRALPRGRYWVKVVSQSRFGYSATSGHPVEDIILSPPLATILKIFDNVPPKDSIEGLGLTVGVARGAGEGTWFGVAVFRNRGYGYEIWAPSIEREASLGHSTNNAINWLGDGSGGSYATLWIIKEGGPDFTNATDDEIAAGKNNYFLGREKLGVKDWTNMGGGLFKGENLVRGLNHTYIFQATHTAQEDFVQLDENVFFIPIEKRDILTALEFKPRTYGLSISEATALPFTPRGDSIRAYAISNPLIARDGRGDWSIRLTGNPRPSEVPESYSCRVWDAAYAVLKKTLPMAPSSTHASLIASTSVDLVGDTIVTGHADGNNLIGGAHDPDDLSSSRVLGITLDPLEYAYQRFDFTIQWTGKNLTAKWIGDNGPAVALQTEPDIVPPFTLDIDNSPLSVSWEAFGITGGNVIGGTVKEVWRSFGQVVATRYNVDPGFAVALDLPLFVSESYLTTILREPSGLELSGALSTIESPGGPTVAGAATVLSDLFNSAEYLARGRTVEEFISDLYLAYLGRNQEALGAAYWLGVYNDDEAASPGSGKPHLLTAFGESIEFRIIIEGIGQRGGRPGPRYTIILSGTEYRGYVNYAPGKAYIAKVSTPSAGYPFPLRLLMAAAAAPTLEGVEPPTNDPDSGKGTCILNVVTGNTIPSTIFSRADQLAVFGDPNPQDTLYLELFQNGKPGEQDGFPVRITATAV